MHIYYETGVETPNILESGSAYEKVEKTADEATAFKLYAERGRNYLRKVMVYSGHRKTYTWDPDLKEWIE